jgi:hypothetical protein
LSLQLKKEAEGLREQASEAAEKLAKLEVWRSAPPSTWPKATSPAIELSSKMELHGC